MNDKQTLDKMLDELRKPFHPSQVSWKPGAVKGERALALAYADLRAYMNRLDEVCGGDWSIAYEPWGEDRIICRLTIMGITRSSTGETSNEAERSEIGGTVAEAQAMKRACAMFGLGRYLYNFPSGWEDYDPKTKQFTQKAKAKLTGMLMQHYRRATEDSKDDPQDLSGSDVMGDAQQSPPHQRLWGQGMAVFGTDWDMARPWLIEKWTRHVTPDNSRNSAGEMSDDEKDVLADYIKTNATQLQRIWPNQKAFMLQAPSNGKLAA